jgi:hypothetical protein
MILKAHINVIDLAEERRRRERAVPFEMSVPPPWFVTSCAVQNLLTARDIEANRRWRLAEAAQEGQPAAPRGRWRANWLLTFLGLSKRSRPS